LVIATLIRSLYVQVDEHAAKEFQEFMGIQITSCEPPRPAHADEVTETELRRPAVNQMVKIEK
jgi:hypothetical protein